MFQKKIVRLFFLLLLIQSLTALSSFAQCAMCRASVASSLSDGGNLAAKLNTGILYLAAMPYLLIAAVGWLWYKNSKKHHASFNHPTKLS